MIALTDPDLLFPAEAHSRSLARDLYAGVKDLPIVSPHGHTDPRWYALNEPFPDPAQLLDRAGPLHLPHAVQPGRPRLRISACRRLDGSPVETDGRAIWRRFAEHYHLFRGTPTRLWFDHVLARAVRHRRAADARRPPTAHYDTHRRRCLQRAEFRPRALFERFNIEVIATTEGALDDLEWHTMIRDSGWQGRVVTAYRPDAVVDPDSRAFPPISTDSARSPAATPAAGPATSTPIASAAPSSRSFGATSSDHGHPTARDRQSLPMPLPKSCSIVSAHGARRRAREAAVPRPDADRDGQDEPRRRARPADPSGLLAQPLAGDVSEVRPRQGLRYPDPHRLCRRR